MLMTHRYVLAVGSGSAPFSPEQIPDAEVLYVMPWEGGNAPDSVAAEAQNPSITDGGSMNIQTDWSGNKRHASLAIGTAQLWRTPPNGIGDGAASVAAAGTSYTLANTGPATPLVYGGTPITVVAVYQDTGGSGALFGSTTAAAAATTPSILDRAGGDVDWNSGADSFDFDAAYTGAHVLLHTQDASDAFGYLDGTQVYTKGSAPNAIPVTNILTRVWSAGTGSSRLPGRFGFFAVYLRKLTDTERDNLTAWLGDTFGIAVAAGFSIASPAPYAVFNRSGAGSGVVRASGTYDSAFISTMDARWSGGSWTPCTLAGGAWSVEVSGTEGTGTLEVRGNGGTFLGSIANVSLGRVVGGCGQSNMLGSSLNKFDFGANTSIGMYDPRPSPQPPMVSREVGQVFGSAYDEGWLPEFLNTRETTDSVPWGVCRFAIGSTRMAFWTPSAAVDAAGFGFSVQYYAELVRACIAAQGLNPATYDPLTDPPVIEAMLLQIGETDARSGTSKADFKAALNAFADGIMADLGVKTHISILQDLFATGYVAVEAQLIAIQDAVTECAAENANIELGPDFSDVVLDTDPPESSGNVHFYTDAQVSLAASRWATAYPGA